MNKTVWLLIIVLVAVIAVAYWQWNPAATVKAPSGNYGPSANVPAGGRQFQPSDNPDTIANNILSDTSRLTPTPSEADPTLVAPSTDISNSLDQSLNAGQF